MFRTILVATDGSEHAGKALAVGCELARTCNGDLHLVHTPELEVIAMAVGLAPAVLPHTPEQVAEAGKKVIDAAAGKATVAGCPPASTHVDQGDPAQVIQEYASKIGADLIITGRRGLGKLGGILMGSVTQKLGQIAPCAHMTVR